MSKILKVENLKTSFFTDRGEVKAVDGVDFTLEKGKTLGIVGESGCGKSITALSVLNLIEFPGRIVEGTVELEGETISNFTQEQMRDIRGNDISMIFQEPMTSLNPVFKVGDQISEALILHQGMTKEEALQKSVEMLDIVGIPRPDEVVHNYPHQLSGGMRQRVMIAMALACNPKILIADEPTTALDVTIQAQILDLMNSLREKLGMSIILITHDLGVVAQMADHIVVMYSGKVVEEASALELFKNPVHPYTRGLLASIPSLKEDKERLESIEGQVPNPLNLPDGCYFAPRCKYATDECKAKKPELVEVCEGHKSRCLYAEKMFKEGMDK